MPSSPVIPHDDPTLLFINAGMNQFKDVFTGRRQVPYSRATSSQKCIRAGGKHNDLDNVGFTARHHTFFEMLGNFSFGDYFKEAAITYAWEWITKHLQLPKDRLYATVYETDDEAFDLWERIAPELKGGRVLRFGKKDNYWAMGDTGPNGPCSELHFDRGERFGTGPEDKVNGETDRFVEIWNLVFMQYDQRPDATLLELPRPSVDTGAGLERLAAILQNADTNYGIDIFRNLIEAISDLTHARYRDHVASHHVIADHIRALSFAIADGAGISNEGRGYVLRRILRRAARHGRQLGAEQPFIYQLVPVLADLMGQTYPELRDKQQHVQNVIKAEEESFLRTLETGLQLFDRIASELKKSDSRTVPGEEVFKLYDTYGFPYDLTEIIANEQGLTLDRHGFDQAMEHQREQSRAGSAFNVDHFIFESDFSEGDPSPTEFVREGLSTQAQVLRMSFNADQIAVALDRTPFYLEAGGQIGDIGRIFTSDGEIEVTDLHLVKDAYVHVGRITRGSKEAFMPGTKVTAQVDDQRRWDIMRNHTATHLAHAALRKVLGDHVRQSGSYVGPDRLRFDFSHHQPMTEDEIRQVEKIVNEHIVIGCDVATEVMHIEQAKKSGAMALFGEKYAESVRVVSVDDFSKELCGGTHVHNTGQIGPFFVIAETGIASGVRRLEAVTGREAIRFMLDLKSFRSQVAIAVGRPETEALEGVRQLAAERSSLAKELKRVKTEMFSGTGKSVGERKQAGPFTLVWNNFDETDPDTMASWADTQKQSNDPVVAVALGTVNGKQIYVAAASGSATKEYGLHVGRLTSELLSRFGGRGGGKPSFAKGGMSHLVDTTRFVATATMMLKDRSKTNPSEGLNRPEDNNE